VKSAMGEIYWMEAKGTANNEQLRLPLLHKVPLRFRQNALVSLRLVNGGAVGRAEYPTMVST